MLTSESNLLKLYSLEGTEQKTITEIISMLKFSVADLLKRRRKSDRESTH